MIDIDASLQAIDSHTPFWVFFSDPGDTNCKLGLEMRADPRQQRRLCDRYVRISASMKTAEDGQQEARDMQISPDWLGLAQELAEYVTGWEGFCGTFAGEKVKRWLKAYSSYAVAFAMNFKGVLDEYEQGMICRKTAEIKN